MKQINYQHLYYFYVVAKEGSVAKASELLHLAPQTVSGQLNTFERYIGAPLFERKGKRLQLNQLGRKAFGFAESIFALGDELSGLLVNEIGGMETVTVGVVDVLPKVFAFDVLKDVMTDDRKLVCKEADMESLLVQFAANKIDIILADRGLTPGVGVRATSNFLGECGLSFYAQHALADRLKGAPFPQNLHNAPMLMLGDKSSQKLNLLSWFEKLAVAPRIVSEFDDSALMKFFGQGGYGVFATPSCIEAHVTEQYQVEVIGRTLEIKERFYAICAHKKEQSSAVARIQETTATMLPTQRK